LRQDFVSPLIEAANAEAGNNKTNRTIKSFLITLPPESFSNNLNHIRLPDFFKSFQEFMRPDIIKTLSFKDSGRALTACPPTYQ
jgi:hypothetical protein